MLKLRKLEKIVFKNGNSNRAIMFENISPKVGRDGFICLIYFIEFSLSHLIVFYRMLIRMNIFWQVLISLLNFLKWSILGELQYFIRIHMKSSKLKIISYHKYNYVFYLNSKSNILHLFQVILYYHYLSWAFSFRLTYIVKLLNILKLRFSNNR